jgi:mono/diheme cytochrome c family protein
MGDSIWGRLARALVLTLALGFVVAVAGCGGDPPEGHVRFVKARALFREICAGCHTLADAGSHGKRLRLDRSYLRPQLLVHNARSVIEAGDAEMPEWRGSLSRREIALLARYVGTVANEHLTRSGDGRRSTTLTPRPQPRSVRPMVQRFADGRALFKEICAGCHALADAEAHGTRVDLDAALAPIPQTRKAAIVRKALRDSDAMPDWNWRLGPSEFDSLVRYVSAVAGSGR